MEYVLTPPESGPTADLAINILQHERAAAMRGNCMLNSQSLAWLEANCVQGRFERQAVRSVVGQTHLQLPMATVINRNFDRMRFIQRRNSWHTPCNMYLLEIW